MRELLDCFDEESVYVFRKSYTTLTQPIYNFVDGKRVFIDDTGRGYVKHNKIKIYITPNMCEKIK